MGLSFIVKQTVPPAPPEPEEQDFIISSGLDDGGGSYADTALRNTTTEQRNGHDYPCAYFCFYPTVPQGATINSAIFTGYTISDGWGTAPTFYLRFLNQDNAAQPINANNASKTAFQNADKTSAITWGPFSNPTGTHIQRVSPNIASIVQTVINRPGWVSGNRLIFYIGGPAANIYTNEFNGQGGIRWRTYDYGNASYYPKLNINWTPPA